MEYLWLSHSEEQNQWMNQGILELTSPADSPSPRPLAAAPHV